MRFPGDMGVLPRVIKWLRAAGHDAVHLHDDGGIDHVRNRRHVLEG